MADHTCARCGAAISSSASWCSLCYTPVTAALEPVAAEDLGRLEETPDDYPHEADDTAQDPFAAPVRASGPMVGGDPHALMVADLMVADAPAPVAPPVQDEKPAATWPCLGCETPNPMGADVCEACGLPFLAYAKEPPRLHVPLVGDIFARSRSQQIVFIAVAGVAFLAILLGLMALFGLII